MILFLVKIVRNSKASGTIEMLDQHDIIFSKDFKKRLGKRYNWIIGPTWHYFLVKIQRNGKASGTIETLDQHGIIFREDYKKR